MRSGKIISLYIEDKTTSKEHNQLTKYNKYIKKQGIKLFYKTDYIDEEERKRVTDAGWHIIELNKINNFWKPFKNHSNPIIAMYAERVNEIYCALQNKLLPRQREDEEIERFYWKGFFYNYLKPYVEKEYGRKYVVEITKTAYNYVAFIVRETRYKKDIPFLELRSRDCRDMHFLAKLLTYGMSGRNEKCLEYDRIQESNTDIPGTLFTTKNSGTKQVLRTNEIEVKSEDEFLLQLNKCLDAYSKILRKVYKGK